MLEPRDPYIGALARDGAYGCLFKLIFWKFERLNPNQQELSRKKLNLLLPLCWQALDQANQNH